MQHYRIDKADFLWVARRYKFDDGTDNDFWNGLLEYEPNLSGFVHLQRNNEYIFGNFETSDIGFTLKFTSDNAASDFLTCVKEKLTDLDCLSFSLGCEIHDHPRKNENEIL
jgi:hypothetical protein